MSSNPVVGGVPVPVDSKALSLLMSSVGVRAGFPSPAEDSKVNRLDVSELLVQHPQATFLIRASGISMVDLGIFDRDLLLVDRALTAQHGDIVIAELEGEFTVKQLYDRNGIVKLLAGNKSYPAIVPREGETLIIFGVVTWTLTPFRRANVRVGRCQ